MEIQSTLINPTGRFVIEGLRGLRFNRQENHCRHPRRLLPARRRCLLRKDPTKVDRSAAYAARYVAKNIVAAGLAEKCEIELAYAIGVANPVSIMIDTFGTNYIAEDKIIELIKSNFDLRPAAIIKKLDLLKPIYRQVAAYGHFGRSDLDLSWERTDKAEILRRLAFGN